MVIQKIPKESILAVIEKLGPCQPIDVRKELKLGDTFLIGAMLSELVADGLLSISKTRRGGGPFYYLTNKPETLEKISSNLNEKDRRTYALLREARVLREDAQEPLVRVGLQNIHDFAYRMIVQQNGAEIAYWRYFIVDEDAAKKLIGVAADDVASGAESDVVQTMPLDSKRQVQEKSPSPAPIVLTNESSEPLAERSIVVKEIVKEKTKEKKSKAKKTAKKDAETVKSDTAPVVLSADIAASSSSVVSAGSDSPNFSTHSSPEDDVVSSPKEKATLSKKSGAAPKKKKGSATSAAPTVTPEGSVVISPEEWLAHDTLYERVQKFANGAQIKEARIYKPHGELTCVMQVDTVVGKLDVFVHALNKKFTEDDIAKSLTVAQARCLPLVIVSVEAAPTKIRKVIEAKGNIIVKTFE